MKCCLPEKTKFTLIRVRKPFHIINWVIMALFTNAFKSVYAHAICRAELVVKTVKRTLRAMFRCPANQKNVNSYNAIKEHI